MTDRTRLWPRADDLRLDRRHFDLRRSENITRILCGAFLLPHAASKFQGGAIAPQLLEFFTLAGLAPAAPWIVLAAAMELLAGVALVLGLCTRYAALLGAGVLLGAIAALYRVKGFAWYWNGGGYEYLVFWSLSCIAVAVHGFRRS